MVKKPEILGTTSTNHSPFLSFKWKAYTKDQTTYTSNKT